MSHYADAIIQTLTLVVHAVPMKSFITSIIGQIFKS